MTVYIVRKRVDLTRKRKLVSDVELKRFDNEAAAQEYAAAEREGYGIGVVIYVAVYSV